MAGEVDAARLDLTQFEGHTRAPWRWYANVRQRRVELRTPDRGCLTVMDFTRWGMQFAQPMFRVCLAGQEDPNAYMGGRLCPVAELETHPDHNGDGTIDHPDARLIEAAPALRDEVERLREALESIRDYWNRDRNGDAMHDACWHAVNTADAALGGEVRADG